MKPAVLLAATLVAGCSSYEPMTLPTDESLVHDVARLSVDTATLPDQALRSYVFDPSDGLDMTEVAMLAVVNNPDLRLLRADVGVTRAQDIRDTVETVRAARGIYGADRRRSLRRPHAQP